QYSFTTSDGKNIVIEKELFIPKNRQMTVIRWKIIQGESALLTVKPLISGRDYHSISHLDHSIDASFEAGAS
ncbi:TPA: hypothetical protein DEF17_07325, partial [bacterium]|nr:hypothetical protein [bacterium]